MGGLTAGQEMAQEKCRDVAAGQAAQERMAGVGREPQYYIAVTQSFVRKLARLSSEADRKLRAMVPAAFVGNVIRLRSTLCAPTRVVIVAEGQGIAAYTEEVGQHKGLGVHLSSDYLWEIVPGPLGIGSTLIAREHTR